MLSRYRQDQHNAAMNAELQRVTARWDHALASMENGARAFGDTPYDVMTYAVKVGLTIDRMQHFNGISRELWLHYFELALRNYGTPAQILLFETWEATQSDE